MHPFWYILAAWTALYGALSLTYVAAILWPSKRSGPPATATDALPHIDILVAARDEEANIADCLKALLAQDYPADRMTIHVGDDDSGDDTAAIVERFAAQDARIRLYRIREPLGDLRAKQNVLAQLARKGDAPLVLVTDADIRPPKGWARRLAQAFRPEVGMVSGPTLVKGGGFLASMQSMDWLLGFGLARAHARLGIPLTGVGNNMAFRREAYEGLGGYEALKFSVVEDYQLFQAMCERGEWKFEQLLEPEATTLSLPVKGLGEWMKQRRRWFRGGLAIAWYNLGAFLLAAVGPLLAGLGLLFLPFEAWWPLAVIKPGCDLLLLTATALRLRKLHWLLLFPVYEVYYLLQAAALLALQFTPGKISWKGRSYRR